MITWFHDTTILGCIKTILRYWCHCVDVYIGQFICTQVSHLQFPVNNYLGIIPVSYTHLTLPTTPYV